jgi:hypothetical protein
MDGAGFAGGCVESDGGSAGGTVGTVGGAAGGTDGIGVMQALNVSAAIIRATLSNCRLRLMAEA